MTDKTRDAISIAGRKIGRNERPFIIAEMSGNHNRSLQSALSIVDAAVAAGAHAIKLQTYTADTMTLDVDSPQFRIEDARSLWAGSSLHELYGQAHTPWEWHEPLFQRARECGIIAFSSPFDATAVDFLETLEAPCYKIASFENTDLPLIRKVAATGKPLIISTGMASLADLDEAVRAARGAGCEDLILLKCTSTYPATPEDTNLATIAHMQQLFGCEVGLSDHTMGIGVPVAAVALGASVIEKHFTLSRAAGGVDSSFSCEPDELSSLVVETQRAWQGLGRVHYGVQSQREEQSLAFRRSLYVCEDVAKGQELNASNVRAIRPGYGLPTKYQDIVLRKHAARDIKRGTPLSWDLLS